MFIYLTYLLVACSLTASQPTIEEDLEFYNDGRYDGVPYKEGAYIFRL